MKLHLRPFIALLAAATLVTTPGALLAADKSKTPVINSSDSKALAAKIGKTVSVEGLVQSTAKGSKDGIRLLNFSSKPGTGFVAAVFPVAYKKVGPIQNYEAKNVRVTGTLEKYKKQTQIKVLKASQIQLLATPKATPAKKKN
jgi:DNA/RNA endonuclease YhcR with UshA esterase domain